MRYLPRGRRSSLMVTIMLWAVYDRVTGRPQTKRLRTARICWARSWAVLPGRAGLTCAVAVHGAGSSETPGSRGWWAAVAVEEARGLHGACDLLQEAGLPSTCAVLCDTFKGVEGRSLRTCTPCHLCVI